jgi:hypothetical protein
VNFCNYPDWYQRGHFFIEEGVSGKYVQERIDNVFHGFHFARFRVIRPICCQNTNWLAFRRLGLEMATFISHNGKIADFLGNECGVLLKKLA